MASLILTLVGPDRPGLVGAVAATVAAHGASWLESRLAHLAGQFAGIVLVELPDDRAAALTAALSAEAGAALAITVHPAPGRPAAGDTPVLQLDLLCQDRPGILHEVTRVLAAAGVNIEELETNIRSGSFSGEHMFHAEARLRLPPDADPAAIRASLEQLGAELMVDLTLSPAPSIGPV